MIIKLNEQIDCNTICKRIAKMVDSYRKENSLDNKIISVKIVDVVDDGDSHVHKLEHNKLS
jgi:hypothetical protein